MPSISERYALVALYEATDHRANHAVDYFRVVGDAGYAAEESERVLAVLASQRLVVLTDLGNGVMLTEAGLSVAHELWCDLPDESGIRRGISPGRETKLG